MTGKILSLYYAEPDPARWIPGDQHLRRIIRRLYRGKPRLGGQGMVFHNLCKGLDLLNTNYIRNDFASLSHDLSLRCVIGKEFILDRFSPDIPIIYGASLGAHPLSRPTLLSNWNIRRILVPGEWMKRMCSPYWGDLVHSWPVGIDQYFWKPLFCSRSASSRPISPRLRILIYDKIRWPTNDISVDYVVKTVSSFPVDLQVIRYGNYQPDEYLQCLHESDAMIFLCEHETQGLAYQEALACNIPVLAWDRGGYWQDPEYYPLRCRFEPVTSVPYWDERCGETFNHKSKLFGVLNEFLEKIRANVYEPRSFILQNLTLEHCAAQYLEHISAVCDEMSC